jgi:hypothetical protein
MPPLEVSVVWFGFRKGWVVHLLVSIPDTTVPASEPASIEGEYRCLNDNQSVIVKVEPRKHKI